MKRRSPLRRSGWILLRTAIAAMLLGGMVRAHAIGDSSGCSYDREWRQVLSTGTVAELDGFIERRLAFRWQDLPPEAHRRLTATPRAMQEWRRFTASVILSGGGPCGGEGYAIDLAIEGGNLPALQWLLHSGVDPNGRRRSGFAVLDRCPFTKPRTGLDASQAWQLTAELYRLLMANGAGRRFAEDPVERYRPVGSTCDRPEMAQLLTDLGVTQAPGKRRANPFGTDNGSCAIPGIDEASNPLIAAVAAPSSVRSGLRFEDSGQEIGEVELVVNSPDRPVVLLLFAHAPRLWKIRTTPGSRILGVVTYRPILSGRQMVIGLEEDTYRALTYCGITYTHGGFEFNERRQPDQGSLNPIERGLRIQFQTHEHADQTVLVGAPLSLQDSALLSPIPETDPHMLELRTLVPRPKEALTGRAAFEAMVADGRLERATVEDYLTWLKTAKSPPLFRNRSRDRAPAFWEAYVNRQPSLRLPEGLLGPDAPIIFTPYDTELPANLGDVTFFFVARTGSSDRQHPRFGSCAGPRC